MAAKGKAEVRAGLIGPEADPREQDNPSPLASAAEAAKSARAAGPKEVVFQARARNYMFQLTAPAPRFDPATGRFTEERPKVAKFQNGEYRSKDQDIIDILKSSPSYGVGRDFWDVAELQERVRKSEEASLLEKLKADPELAKRVVSQLSESVSSFEP